MSSLCKPPERFLFLCALFLLPLIEESDMRTLIASVTLALLSTLAHAGNAACDAKAAEKKLAGAAKTASSRSARRMRPARPARFA